MHQVFVYGTLKRGFPNFAGNMERFACLGRFRTREALPLVIGGRWRTPCLIPEPGAGFPVLGEVFAVDEAGLARLDELEGVGHPRGYRRILLAVAPEPEAGGGQDGEAPAGEPGHEPVDKAWAYVKDRHLIEGIHAGPLPEYPLDPEYVIPSKRPGVF